MEREAEREQVRTSRKRQLDHLPYQRRVGEGDAGGPRGELTPFPRRLVGYRELGGAVEAGSAQGRVSGRWEALVTTRRQVCSIEPGGHFLYYRQVFEKIGGRDRD
jgi:hypothetical protein